MDLDVSPTGPADGEALEALVAERDDVRSVPTLILFREGEAVARRAEGVQGAAVAEFLAEHAPVAAPAE